MRLTRNEIKTLLGLSNTSCKSGCWRPELSERIDVADTTVFDQLKNLKEYEFVKHYDEKKGDGVGRKRRYWYLTGRGKQAVLTIKKRLSKAQ
jgi:predicted ArsR family transcriptional regulator